ncbi:MAG: lysostaphin resistance A-like protein [Gammaproteobacteria bacterium]
MNAVLRPKDFLPIALIFEGSLALLAFLLGWLLNIDPLQHIAFKWSALGWGLLGTAPLLAFFFVSYHIPTGALVRIKSFLVQILGPPLAVCRGYQLALLAGTAGFSEELLFRGALLPWLGSLWGPSLGLLASSALFGLAHSITPLYALLAGLTGVYLGLSLDIGGERNLAIPIIIHAVYDFIAFVAVARTFRRDHTT